MKTDPYVPMNWEIIPYKLLDLRDIISGCTTVEEQAQNIYIYIFAVIKLSLFKILKGVSFISRETK